MVLSASRSSSGSGICTSPVEESRNAAPSLNSFEKSALKTCEARERAFESTRRPVLHHYQLAWRINLYLANSLLILWSTDKDGVAFLINVDDVHIFGTLRCCRGRDREMSQRRVTTKSWNSNDLEKKQPGSRSNRVEQEQGLRTDAERT